MIRSFLVSEGVHVFAFGFWRWKCGLILCLGVSLVEENAFHALVEIFITNRLCIAYLRELFLLKSRFVRCILLYQLQEIVLITASIEWTSVSKILRTNFMTSYSSDHFEILLTLSFLRRNSRLIFSRVRSESL